MFRASVSSESKQGWVKSQLLQIFGPNDNKLALKLFGSKKALMRPKVGFNLMEVHLVQLIGEPEPEKSTCSPGEAEEGAELGDPPNVPVQVDIFLKLFLLIFNSSIIHLNIEYSTGRHVSVNGQI